MTKFGVFIASLNDVEHENWSPDRPSAANNAADYQKKLAGLMANNVRR